MNCKILISIFLIFTLARPVKAAVTYYHISDYTGRDDNPFLNDPSLGTVYLEDFETQSATLSNSLTTPYATGWNGAAVGSSTGGLPGDHLVPGSLGWQWSDNWIVKDWTKGPEGIHFDFSADPYGRLPEYVGAAILGRVDQFNAGGLFNSIFVYDKDGNEVTEGHWKLSKPLYSELELLDPDMYFSNFEGIYVPGGISRIQFRDFIEVDHLTYGYAPIPEPATVSLAGLAAASLLGRRTRKRAH